MGNIVKNVGLVLAMGTVIIMCIIFLLSEYIPNGLTVEKANTYKAEEETTKILSDAEEAKKLLSSQNQNQNSNSDTTTTVKTNIVLKEYDVSKTDLALYKQSGSYKSGRADPFAEVTADNVANTTGQSGNTGNPQSGGNSTGTGNTTTVNNTQSDGTFYNSARQK